MLLCESILMALISLLGIYASYTDFKSGIIPNRSLIIAFSLGGVVNVIYLALFARDYVLLYLTNLVIMTAFSVALYGFHFWAAGDSKLLICLTALMPGRLYDNDLFSFAPGINVFIYIFLIAYFYIVVDSIICLLKKRKFYAGRSIGFGAVKQFLINYLICFIYMRALSEVIRFLLNDFYYENQLIFSFLFFFIAIIIHTKPIFKKWYMIGLAVVLNLTFVFSFKIQMLNVYSYVILLIALILRYLLNGYNYVQIPTESVNKGMVLSIPTIMLFSTSRIKGLPHHTFEDMRSRLSEEEAEAVKRWKDSKQGMESITIVRKIPFAIFVVLGEILYFFIRIWR